MPSLVTSAQLTLVDLNDAIIAGTAPASPVVDTLWIDTSLSPPRLKKWNGSAWIEQQIDLKYLDPNADGKIEDHEVTFANILDDNKLSIQDRTFLKDKITAIVGLVQADTATTLPTLASLDGGLVGEVYSLRKQALNVGLLSSDAAYVALGTEYNNLKAHLDTLTPRPWDTGATNKKVATSITSSIFRDKWLKYYTAADKLAEAIAAKVKKNADDATKAAEDADALLRQDLKLTAPLPTSIKQDANGITAYTADPLKYARLDYRGLYIAGGAIQISGGLPDSQIANASKWNGQGTYIDQNGVYTGVVSANQITAGTITGLTINGSTINSINGSSSTVIVGAKLTSKVVAADTTYEETVLQSGTVVQSSIKKNSSNVNYLMKKTFLDEYGLVIRAGDGTLTGTTSNRVELDSSRLSGGSYFSELAFYNTANSKLFGISTSSDRTYSVMGGSTEIHVQGDGLFYVYKTGGFKANKYVGGLDVIMGDVTEQGIYFKSSAATPVEYGRITGNGPMNIETSGGYNMNLKPDGDMWLQPKVAGKHIYLDGETEVWSGHDFSTSTTSNILIGGTSAYGLKIDGYGDFFANASKTYWTFKDAAGKDLIKAYATGSSTHVEVKRKASVILDSSLVNSWLPYGGSYTGPRVHKTVDGMVILEGLVKSGTAAHILTLPVGYRPAGLGFYLCMGTSNSVVRVDIDDTGTVVISGTVPGFVSLNGITFEAIN